MSSEPKEVAIIGGGIAGLSCAAHIAKSAKSITPTVFDTGRLRPGGRCSSRYPNDRPADTRQSRATLLSSFLIDHAAQILTVSKDQEHFQKQVDEWESVGIVTKFPKGSIVEILSDSKSNSYRIKELNTNEMYYATNGMGSIPNAIAKSAPYAIKQDVWISPSNGVQYLSRSNSCKWKLKAKGRERGQFDYLIIAHNGKCADRLMSRTPAKALHSLLRTNFAPTVPAHGGKRMTLNSIYSLIFIMKKSNSPLSSIPSNVISAFIKNHKNLSFLSCNTRKYPSIGNTKDYEAWTLLSSAKFAKQYKGPQENLTDELQKNVTSILFQSLEECLNLSPNSLNSEILETKLQLWGAAVPLNIWKPNEFSQHASEYHGFVYDGEFGVGVCGDWLLDSSIYGAWESGRRMADYLLEKCGDRMSEGLSVGLPPNGSFEALDSVRKAGIGSL